MIGQADRTCIFQVCDSINTRTYSDQFSVMSFRNDKALFAKETKHQVTLCKDHVDEIVASRERGEKLCMTQEGWVYVDNLNWLLY